METNVWKIPNFFVLYICIEMVSVIQNNQYLFLFNKFDNRQSSYPFSSTKVNNKMDIIVSTMNYNFIIQNILE